MSATSTLKTPFPADAIPLPRAAELIPGNRPDGTLDPTTLKRWALKGLLPYYIRQPGGRMFFSRQELLDFVRLERGCVSLAPEARVRGEAEERARETQRVLREVGLAE